MIKNTIKFFYDLFIDSKGNITTLGWALSPLICILCMVYSIIALLINLFIDLWEALRGIYA